MRQVFIVFFLTLAYSTLLLFPVGTGLAADFPEIVLESTSDVRLDTTLRAALNAAELKHSSAGADRQATTSSMVDAERLRLEEMMRGMGYLEARIDASAQADGQMPKEIAFTPQPGPLYRLGLIEVDGLASLLPAVRDDIVRQMATSAGKPASGEVLASLEHEVYWRVRSASFPLADITGRDLSPMPGQALAKARIVVDPGSVAQFGAVTYKGLVSLKAEDIARLQPFKQGDAYDPRVLDRFHEALVAHPSIRTARVQLADRVDANGQLPLRVDIGEEQLAVRDAGGGFRLGLIVTLSAVAALAIRQMWFATLGPGRSRWPKWFDALTIVMLAAALYLGVERLLLLASPG